MRDPMCLREKGKTDALGPPLVIKKLFLDAGGLGVAHRH